MGACLRSKETLALYMTPFFWKKLSGEKISWKNDFSTVDLAQVKLLENIEKMDQNEYSLKYADIITWSCVLGDGTVYEIKPQGNQIQVGYSDRLEYCDKVKQIRLAESDKQVREMIRNFRIIDFFFVT
jgi:hypothetical protein